MYKKIILTLISCFILAGCSRTLEAKPEYKDKFAIEKDANIVVSVRNDEYGKGLVEMFNKNYPKHAGKLSYVVRGEITLEEIRNPNSVYPDLFMVRDAFVGSMIDKIEPFEIDLHHNMEISYPLEYGEQTNSMFNYYIPMEFKGNLFVYNKSYLKDNDIDISVMKSFESIIDNKDKIKMYYNSDFNYMYPFLSGKYTMFENNNYKNHGMQSDELYDSLKDFKALYKDLKLIDEPIRMTDFLYNNSYQCGLLYDWLDIEKIEKETNQDLVITKMPTYKDNQLKTVSYSLGYVMSKDCKYPMMANEVMRMMRSKEGIQLYIDTNPTKVVNIDKKYLEEFNYTYKHYKEKVKAYNYTNVQSLIAVNGHVSKRAYDLIFELNLNVRFQEYLDGKIKLADLRKNIDEEYDKWIEPYIS